MQTLSYFFPIQEEQGFFDIHEYGSTVLSRLQKCTSKTKDKVQFSKVVEDSEIYDISRMFLATLQLVWLIFIT